MCSFFLDFSLFLFYFYFYLLSFFFIGFSSAGLGVVEYPGNMSSFHQVIFTEPIAAIVVHNLCKKKNFKKNPCFPNIKPYRIGIYPNKKTNKKMHNTLTHMEQQNTHSK